MTKPPALSQGPDYGLRFTPCSSLDQLLKWNHRDMSSAMMPNLNNQGIPLYPNHGLWAKGHLRLNGRAGLPLASLAALTCAARLSLADHCGCGPGGTSVRGGDIPTPSGGGGVLTSASCRGTLTPRYSPSSAGAGSSLYSPSTVCSSSLFPNSFNISNIRIGASVFRTLTSSRYFSGRSAFSLNIKSMSL